jgi:hypothetical protein
LEKKILSKKNTFEILWSEVWLMLILGLIGMYFDAAVVFLTNSQLFFWLAVAILWVNFPANNLNFHLKGEGEGIESRLPS